MAIVPTARFLHIGFFWSGPPKIAPLEVVFNDALDWARYTQYNWVLWTTTDPATWLARIRPHLGPQDNVVICHVDLSSTPLTYTGWADKWFWEWIQKHQ